MPVASTARRLRDIAIYVAIGLLVVIAAFLYQDNFGRDTTPVAKWGGLFGMTAILFGYAAASHKPLFRSPRFWGVLAGLLVIHVSIFVVVLLRATEWKVLWFVILFPIENIIIDFALSVSMHRK